MTPKQIDRLLSILDRAVKVAERWADREYPIADESKENEIGISRAGDHRPPQSVEAYNAFEPEEDAVARFEKRIRRSS